MEPAGRSEGIEIGRRQGRNSSGVLKTYVEQNHERGVCPTSRPPEEDDMEKWVRYCLIEGCYIVMVFCVYIIIIIMKMCVGAEEVGFDLCVVTEKERERERAKG